MAKTLKALPRAAADAAPTATYASAMALKALRDGKAEPHQQQIAVEWIVADAGGKRHFPYHSTDRDTAFALGRLFVSEQIVGLLNVDPTTLRRDHVPAQP